MQIKRLAILSCFALFAAMAASPASALTMKECSTKYNAAKDAGTLDGRNWTAFRKAECGTDDSAKAAPAKPARKTSKAAATSTTEEEAGGLSMKVCSAKYQAAKDADALNGLNWNDFRKTECGPGATAEVAKPAKKATKAAAASDGEVEDEAGGLSMKDCSAKYQAAKDADALNGLKWNDFRKSECGPGATAEVAKPATKTAKAAAASGDSSQKLSMKECSAKYQTAKADDSLNGMKWNDFRKSECGANASDDDTVPSFDEANYSTEPESPVTAAPRGVSFPRGIARKFLSETPAKQRMHTCLEEYYSNKDADTLNGLRWIQKGGGYYSICNARLKQDS